MVINLSRLEEYRRPLAEIPFLMQLTEKTCHLTSAETDLEIPALPATFFAILATVLLVTNTVVFGKVVLQ